MAEEKQKKNKKISKMSLDEINNKIKSFEEAGQTHSKYYQHLIIRKLQLQKQID